MIISFAHKGLETFYYHHSLKGIQPNHAEKLRKILENLDFSPCVVFKNPAYKTHRLKGNLKDFYAVSIDKNYRLIFKVTDEGIELVNYLDYH